MFVFKIPTLLNFLLSITTFVQGVVTVFTEVDWSEAPLRIRSRIEITGRLQDYCADTPS